MTDPKDPAAGANLNAAVDDPICYRLEPEKRLVPRFDSSCIAEFPVAPPEVMGMRVLDNCCEDHMM